MKIFLSFDPCSELSHDGSSQEHKSASKCIYYIFLLGDKRVKVHIKFNYTPAVTCYVTQISIMTLGPLIRCCHI